MHRDPVADILIIQVADVEVLLQGKSPDTGSTHSPDGIPLPRLLDDEITLGDHRIGTRPDLVLMVQAAAVGRLLYPTLCIIRGNDDGNGAVPAPHVTCPQASNTPRVWLLIILESHLRDPTRAADPTVLALEQQDSLSTLLEDEEVAADGFPGVGVR
jgi:hypothetical protein